MGSEFSVAPMEPWRVVAALAAISVALLALLWAGRPDARTDEERRAVEREDVP